MGHKLSQADMDLYRAVDEVLQFIWDPIGVRGFPEARDEYHAYLPHVFGMVRSGEGAEAIGSYLCGVATEGMGLSKNLEHDMRAADALVHWRKFVQGKYAAADE